MICVRNRRFRAGAVGTTIPRPAFPRTKDGKPNLSAADAARRERQARFVGSLVHRSDAVRGNGAAVPGLEGVRGAGRRSAHVHQVLPEHLRGLPPEDVPFRPEAAQAFMQRLAAVIPPSEAPTARCFPAGIPMGDLLPLPRRSIHTPRPARDSLRGHQPAPHDLHGRANAPRRSPARVDGIFGRQVGRRHVRGARATATATGAGWTASDTRAAKPRGSPSASAAATSATWRSTSRSTTPSPTPSRSRSDTRRRSCRTPTSSSTSARRTKRIAPTCPPSERGRSALSAAGGVADDVPQCDDAEWYA